MDQAPRKKTLKELRNEAIAGLEKSWLRRSRQDAGANQNDA